MDIDIEEIPRQPYTPDENTLRPVDGSLLQFFIETIYKDWHCSVYDPIDGNYGQWPWESLGHDVFQRFGPTLSSTVVRNAVLLLSLRNHLEQHNHELLEMEYKDRFYGAMRKAISTHAYIDLLYASYFACFAALLESPLSVDDFIRHFKGFVSVLITVAPVCTPAEARSACVLFAHIMHMRATFKEWTHLRIKASENLKQLFETAVILLNSANRGGTQGWHSTYGRYPEVHTRDFRPRTRMFWSIRLGPRLLRNSLWNLGILQLCEGH